MKTVPDISEKIIAAIAINLTVLSWFIFAKFSCLP